MAELFTPTKGGWLRWTRFERLQHGLAAFSFIILVISGFALRYPESWWAHPFTHIWPHADIRALIHRLFASLFMLVSLLHLSYLFITKRGRAQLLAIWPRMRDARDLWDNLRFYLGLRKSPPLFDHYTYWEKIEYWALIWGSVIMALTGVMLWFENTALQFFPLWLIDVAAEIHLYEALLATWAIVVWHLYFAIFRPSIYPMDASMIKGTHSQARLEEEHHGVWMRLKEDEAREEK